MQANSDEALEIMNCLKSYSDASGQRINLDKSSIIFGSMVPPDARREVKETLGLDKEEGDGTYLGLPECLDRRGNY